MRYFAIASIIILLLAGIVSAESVFILQPNVKEVKYKAIVDIGTIVTKPTCPTGWVPSIFVTPAVVAAYSAATGWQLNVIGVFKTSATDNGDGTWTVNMQLKDNAGNVINSGGGTQRLLVEAMCCPSGGSCQ
ncbi:MAG: hypothetical protein ACHQ0Y_13175 [Thermodesulfovibrionales bacterium]